MEITCMLQQSNSRLLSEKYDFVWTHQPLKGSLWKFNLTENWESSGRPGVICKNVPSEEESLRSTHLSVLANNGVEKKTLKIKCLPDERTFIQVVPLQKLTVDISCYISQISLLINTWKNALELWNFPKQREFIGDVFLSYLHIKHAVFIHVEQTCSLLKVDINVSLMESYIQRTRVSWQAVDGVIT